MLCWLPALYEVIKTEKGMPAVKFLGKGQAVGV